MGMARTASTSGRTRTNTLAFSVSFDRSDGVWAREEDERGGMTWPYNCEVPLIQRCDFGEPQALRDGYHGGIAMLPR